MTSSETSITDTDLGHDKMIRRGEGKEGIGGREREGDGERERERVPHM